MYSRSGTVPSGMFCAALSCGRADGRRRLPREVALPLLEARLLLLRLEPLLRAPDDLLLIRRLDEGEEEAPFLDPVRLDPEREDFAPWFAIHLPPFSSFAAVWHPYPTLRLENLGRGRGGTPRLGWGPSLGRTSPLSVFVYVKRAQHDRVRPPRIARGAPAPAHGSAGRIGRAASSARAHGSPDREASRDRRSRSLHGTWRRHASHANPRHSANGRRVSTEIAVHRANRIDHPLMLLR